MAGELEQAKRRLRRSLGARRRSLAPDFVQRAGERMAAHFAADPVLRRALRTALYAAQPDEMPTQPLFEALAPAVRLLPRLRGERLEFAVVETWGALRPGRFGVLEPPADAPARTPGADDVVLLPGVAFDGLGRRLGRGGGHYDRAFPPGTRGPRLVGAAFAFQIVEEVPHGSHDRIVDAIVSEEGVRWVPDGADGE